MPRVTPIGRRARSRSGARVPLGAKAGPVPGFIKPALAMLRTTVPTTRGFVSELKLDGYRVQLGDGRGPVHEG